MDRVAGFTPEQARLLWQDYQTRQQLQPQLAKNYPIRREISEVSPHRVFVKNTESEVIPPYACMRITGVEVIGDRTAITVEKPSSIDGEFLFNSQYEIPVASGSVTGVGWAYRYGVVVMLGDEPTDEWEAYRAIEDSWEVEPGGGRFIVYGRHDADDRALLGQVNGGVPVVVLSEDLEAAADRFNDSTLPSALANSTRRLSATSWEIDPDSTITLYNRAQNVSYEANTLGTYSYVLGKPCFLPLDCGPPE